MTGMFILLMFEQLDRYISSLINWTESEKQGFFDRLYCKEYPQGNWIYQTGDTCDKIYFVKSGLLGSTLYDDSGRTFITHFIFENNFATDLVWFLHQQQAWYGLQSLEDTACIVIRRNVLQWLYDHVKEGNRLGSLVYEQIYYILLCRYRFNYLRTPEQKYQQMLDMYPGIEQRVSKKCISSYIGVDPAYFSRLKLI